MHIELTPHELAVLRIALEDFIMTAQQDTDSFAEPTPASHILVDCCLKMADTAAEILGQVKKEPPAPHAQSSSSKNTICIVADERKEVKQNVRYTRPPRYSLHNAPRRTAATVYFPICRL